MEAHSHETHESAAPEKVLATGPEAPVKVTAKAVDKVRAFAAGNKEAAGKHLRIYVQGGGCSGFEYGFTFDEKREDDQIIAAGDVEVVIDPMTLPYLKGALVDYVEDFQGSGFVVQNPNATGSCGCGHSFSV